MKRGKAKYYRKNKAKCVYFYNYRRKQKELKLLKLKRDELNKKFEEGNVSFGLWLVNWLT